jgi:hypothetical protein
MDSNTPSSHSARFDSLSGGPVRSNSRLQIQMLRVHPEAEGDWKVMPDRGSERLRHHKRLVMTMMAMALLPDRRVYASGLESESSETSKH